MNKRWIAPALLGFVALELLAATVAYSTPTWNFNHTEVLHGWACVRFVCLIVIPVTLAAAAAFSTLMIITLRWASRGHR